MSDDLPNGRELRDRLARIEERLSSLKDQVDGIIKARARIFAWLGTVSAGVAVAIAIALIRN